MQIKKIEKIKELSKPVWEQIKLEDIKFEDIIYVWYKNKFSCDHFIITEDGWFDIFKHEYCENPIDNEKEHELYKQNYRFISKPDEWYLTGTEAFLESDSWGETLENASACFRGCFKDEKSDKIGDDGEVCALDEFDIFEI